MARKTGKCWACNELRGLDGHHIFPREYGGPDDGELVNICKSCHDIIHDEAEFYYKNGQLRLLDKIHAPDTFIGKNLRILIAKIIKAKQMFEAGEVNSGEQRRMTQISWSSDQELLMAHAVKKAMHFKSLERAIKHLVFEKYRELLQ